MPKINYYVRNIYNDINSINVPTLIYNDDGSVNMDKTIEGYNQRLEAN